MRFTWRAGVSLLILWALAVGHLAAAVPGNDQPDKKENPVFIIAILIGHVEPSCEPGRPVAFLKVRVTNKSRVGTPALPASDGIEAQDRSTPPWRGTAALPALRPGQVIEVAIPLVAPSNLLPGKHEFQVTVNPRHIIEQQHYQFNSAGPAVVDIPAGFCRTASIRAGAENLTPTNTATGRSPNVPERAPQQQPEPPRNEPRRSGSAGQSATSKVAAEEPQKQGLSITITPAAQAYTLAGSCVANKPVLILHVHITDTGTTQLPNLPYMTAVLARDTGKPAWGGGTGLLGLSPGASEDRNISLYPPSRPQTAGGMHRFTVATLGFSSAPIEVNVPTNFCSALVLQHLPPKVITMAATQANQSGAKNSVEDKSKKIDVSKLANSIQQKQQTFLKNSAIYQAQPLPVPSGLTSTTDPHACYDHAGVGGGFVCEGALPQGRMALIWNAPQQPSVDGYRVYRVDADRTDHVGDQANGTGVTFYMLAAAPGGPSGYTGQCYAVTSFRGSAESHPSAAHCVGGGEVIQTAVFPMTEMREIQHFKNVCNGIGGGTTENYYDPGLAEVGYWFWDGGQQGITHCWNNTVTRLAVKFDVSSLAGKTIRAAQVKLKVDTTDTGSGQDHHTSCLAQVGPGVDEWWNYGDWIAGDPSLNIGAGIGPDIGYDVTPIVRNWVQYGFQNYGLVLMGADENMSEISNSVCDTQYLRTQTSLEVQYQ